MELPKGKLYFLNNGGEYKELGRIENAEINQEYKTCSSITGERWTVPLSRKFEGTIDGDETETIKLDETLMK